MTAAAVTVFAVQVRRSNASATTLALEREAAEIGRTIDAAVRTVHERANNIASAPMLRAAVLTDAATVADMMSSEFKLELAPGEVAELFQIDDASQASLIRMPATAAALPRLRDRGAAIAHLDAGGVRVVVGAHIDRLRDGVGYDSHKAGVLELSAPVDLAAIRRQLSERAVDATLAQAGASVQLVHRALAAGELVSLVVPSETAALTLTVAPAPSGPHMPWIAPLRNASFGLGTLFVIAFALILALRRPRPRRA